ncbi:uncharacterized protein BO95DRAFT_270645 [Aspergillus brunneoviolaceus CBS 621.78]|uniref:Uncharacterized protein n=2 Tax=Aspergillus TaxID=5052 RepID=A0A8G1W092_9EURO|nr:hypothetical protein BO95DRAFT_270645 [Aspergillus brunneoviolaceus CBS 621.78]XP_040803137.1 uncharacterized protein BO72DRAFT_52801 [Aspergillus fijiensis CBS 313.89]RAH49689.1 hypothetical protein BO95DRAFT_270645 [Aspergillus brunneoviolaceus CBS 621.78]RAK79127.1 hypothetical protein BO72DRAFT_52801 [Aspergillus fijiensis CBS 313.89]
MRNYRGKEDSRCATSCRRGKRNGERVGAQSETNKRRSALSGITTIPNPFQQGVFVEDHQSPGRDERDLDSKRKRKEVESRSLGPKWKGIGARRGDRVFGGGWVLLLLGTLSLSSPLFLLPPLCPPPILLLGTLCPLEKVT